MTKRICGFRPTGRLHVGHYLSVVVPAVEQGAYVLVADYHAPDADDELTRANIEALIRLGVPAGQIVRQKAVFNAPLYFELMALADVGRLERMTQYKSTPPGERTGHLLTYPVMMAVDVAGYDEVYVGEDQVQHVEYARDLLKARMRQIGRRAQPGDLPKAVVVAGRVRDLRDPTRKMSKSQPKGCLFLDDDADAIRKKVARAVTTPEGLDNLEFLHGRFVGGPAPESNALLKGDLAEALVRLLCAEGVACTA